MNTASLPSERRRARRLWPVPVFLIAGVAFTAFLGFEVNDGEYKVMGMAPYGEPRYVDKVKQVIHLQPDGSFWLDMDYFAFHYSREQTIGPNGVD